MCFRARVQTHRSTLKGTRIHWQTHAYNQLSSIQSKGAKTPQADTSWQQNTVAVASSDGARHFCGTTMKFHTSIQVDPVMLSIGLLHSSTITSLKSIYLMQYSAISYVALLSWCKSHKLMVAAGSISFVTTNPLQMPGKSEGGLLRISNLIQAYVSLKFTQVCATF